MTRKTRESREFTLGSSTGAVPFDWSEHAPYIQSLFRPWRPDDGYSAAELVAAEASLGFRLPGRLRGYYASWGHRRDMNQMHNELFYPEHLIVRTDDLVFCAENQGVWLWGIPLASLDEPDPPVHEALNNWSASQGPGVDHWEPRYPRLSDFLNELTLMHALCGGAVHGGRSHPKPLDPETADQLERQWRWVMVTPRFYGLMPDADFEAPGVYLRKGMALFQSGVYRSQVTYSVAAGSAEDLAAIADEFGLTWEKQW